MASKTETALISTSSFIAGDYFRSYNPSIEPMYLLILGFFLIALSKFARNKFRSKNRTLTELNSKEWLPTETHSEDNMAIRDKLYWEKKKENTNCLCKDSNLLCENCI